MVRLLLVLPSLIAGVCAHGFDLIPAYFDQRREALDNDSRHGLLEWGGSDMIEVAGKTRHVTSYLRDFMFDD